MLYLISLGLEEGDITLKGIEAAKTCKTLYLENYTSLGPSKEYYENIFNKPITLLEREDVESEKLIEESKKHNIALLIYGDALSATTHISLLETEYEIIHGVSILTAISNTGLSLYKFGKTASIPFTKTDTPYQILKNNKGMHTLFLLDLDPKNNKFLDINQGIQYLLNKGMEDRLVIACEKLGTKQQIITKGKASELINKQFKLFPQCIIVPAELHFMEEEFLFQN